MICLFAYIFYRYYAQSVPAVEKSRQVYAGIGRYMDLLCYPGSGPAIVFSFGDPFQDIKFHRIFCSASDSDQFDLEILKIRDQRDHALPRRIRLKIYASELFLLLQNTIFVQRHEKAGQFHLSVF